MPEISDILVSVQSPSLIKDSLISRGKLILSPTGKPQFYSGGFTVVFPVLVEKEKWAFRCWHTELGAVRKRFKLISEYINQLQSPYFCDFFYNEEGIVVEGKIFPTSRMRWIEGTTINQYLQDNRYKKDVLLQLANRFVQMIDYLHSQKIAHGDLQHGNILIQDNEIKLVDYDSLFCPGMEGMSDIITGKADFQHPNRKNAKEASYKVDYFSELVIYLSILAIAEQPELVTDFSLEDSLLFQASDWSNFANSTIYKRLVNLGNDDIILLLEILNEYLAESDINNLRPFTEIWKERLAKPEIHSLQCGNNGIVYKGIESTIKWSVEHVSLQFLNAHQMDSTIRESKKIFDHDDEIVLTIKNGLHTVEKRLPIRVVSQPKIVFRSEKKKLRKTAASTESTTLSWSVKNAHSVELRADDKVISRKMEMQGLSVKPDSDTTYNLVVIGLDENAQFTRSIDLKVREPAEIVFESDKQYSLPGVPVVLTWKVSHCKKVTLEQQEVPKSGSTVVKPSKAQQYTLEVTDDFGKTAQTLSIQTLPLPIIKGIMVPTPIIERNVSMSITPPQFQHDVTIPIVHTEFVTLDSPNIPDLKDSGFYVNLKTPPYRKLSERISSLLQRIFRKII